MSKDLLEEDAVKRTAPKSAEGGKTAEVKKDAVKKAEGKKSEVKSSEIKKAGVKKTEVKKSEVKKDAAKKSEVKKAEVKKTEVKKTEVKKIKTESSGNEIGNEEKKDKKIKVPNIVIPIVAAIAVLTVGVLVSSASLGLLGTSAAEEFVETKQSATELASPSGVFLDGISVQGVDLGGKTMQEAQELLCIEESKMIPSINYTLTCHDKIVYLTEDDFTFLFDTVEVLNRAYEYSEYMRNVLTAKGRTEIKDSEKIDYPISMQFVDSSIADACKVVGEKVNVKMQDAHVSNIDTTAEEVYQMFSFEDGVVGYSLDENDLLTQLSTLLKNETYTAEIIGQMEVVEPSITTEELKKNLVLISMYTTYSGNDWAGNMNMTTAMQSMTGSIIRPGEVFSFNEKTGNSNLAENGYYSAGVIVNGQSTNGIGGGICQAATTIYNAAIRADMTVVEREPHTWPSVYVPVGIDSAIDYGNIDMKFQNNTDHEVYLICYMEGATLYAYIYGYRPDDFDEIVISSWFTGSGGSGFGAAACRNYYKDGELIKSEDLPSSYYSDGGGTSYAFDEQPTDYKFQRVFTDKQIAESESEGDSEEPDNSPDDEESQQEVQVAEDNVAE